MRAFLFVTMCLPLALLLAGCYANTPKPMARGYSSYGQEFKSVSGADARDVGYDYSKENNDAVLKAQRHAARDLVEKLDQKLNFSVDKIYLTIPRNTAFYNSFDHLLRDELVQKGYLLSSSDENAVKIEFVAKEIALDCTSNEGEALDYNAYIALAMNVVDKVPSATIGGFYSVPMYDYVDAGNVKLDIPLCP